MGYLGPFVAKPGSVNMLLGQSSTHLWNGFAVSACDANSTGSACAPPRPCPVVALAAMHAATRC